MSDHSRPRALKLSRCLRRLPEPFEPSPGAPRGASRSDWRGVARVERLDLYRRALDRPRPGSGLPPTPSVGRPEPVEDVLLPAGGSAARVGAGRDLLQLDCAALLTAAGVTGATEFADPTPRPATGREPSCTSAPVDRRAQAEQIGTLLARRTPTSWPTCGSSCRFTDSDLAATAARRRSSER
jgi:hypothetical protein